MSLALAALHGVYGILIGLGFLLLVVGIALFLITRLSRRRFEVPSSGDSVLITGASTGIGRASAMYLVKRGFVVFAGVRNVSDGEALQASAASGAESTTHGTLLIPILLDVRNTDQIHEAVRTVQDETLKRGTALRALINNAGVTGGWDPLEFVSLEYTRAVFDVNYFGALACCKAFLPMIRATRGRIINMSSLSGRVTRPMNTIYGSSKYALEAMSDCLRMEVADHGVSVSIIEPGFVKTEILPKAQLIQAPHNVSEDCRRLYGHLYTYKKTAAVFEKADDPVVVCQAVYHALTSPYPKTRYLVGNANGVSVFWLVTAAWLLNDRLLDGFRTPKLRADHNNFADASSYEERTLEKIAQCGGPEEHKSA